MRGGRRKGAGRKQNPNKKVPYTMKLRRDLRTWLQGKENASKHVEKVLDYARALELFTDSEI